MKQNIIFPVLSLGTCLTGIMNRFTFNKATKAEVNTHKQIKVNDSGSIYPAIKALAETYETNNSQTQITFLPKSQSGSGIAGVKKEMVEIGAVSRKLKQKEVEPTPTNLETGKYKMVRNIGIAWSKKPSANTQEFLNFAFSHEGSNILRQSSFAPQTQK